VRARSSAFEKAPLARNFFLLFPPFLFSLLYRKSSPHLRRLHSPLGGFHGIVPGLFGGHPIEGSGTARSFYTAGWWGETNFSRWSR